MIDDEDSIEFQSARARLRSVVTGAASARRTRLRKVEKVGERRAAARAVRSETFTFRCTPDLKARVYEAVGKRRGALAEFMEEALEAALAKRGEGGQ